VARVSRLAEQRSFRNEDLVLRVSPHSDPARWNHRPYEEFLENLVEGRKYQKEALLVSLRFLFGGRYSSLRALAEENFESSEAMRDRYGNTATMEKHLLFPDLLAANLDLATGTGKSYVLYGLATVALAAGVVDRVLVLCPSRTIEAGLLEKFRRLAGDSALRDALPNEAAIRVPRIIDASETIIPGSICVENYHAILKNVRSSVRESLGGRGDRTLLLNDEVHHVASAPGAKVKRWHEFVMDPAFGLRCVIGVSGTCYRDDDYFGDVIHRYSLREAFEDRAVKLVEYVVDEEIGKDPSEQWQIILKNHEANRKRYRKTKPLTIFVTKDISNCERLAREWIEFLGEEAGIDEAEAAKKVFVVTSAAKHEPNVARLQSVDSDKMVEWIFSVSMLTEGWDVKNVFQIVPHEERAFDSKLLISQVLGRGLRIPPAYQGLQPTVTVFNHAKWSGRIKHLVQEVLEIEKRLTCSSSRDTYHFEIHQIDYDRDTDVRTYPHVGDYELFEKGYVSLPSQVAALDREIEYEDALTSARRTQRVKVTQRMYKLEEVARQMWTRLKEWDQEGRDDPRPGEQTRFAENYPLDRLRRIVRESLRRANIRGERIVEDNRQKLLQALGPLRREAAKAVRYVLKPKPVHLVSTKRRPSTSVSYNQLRRGDAAIAYDDKTENLLENGERDILAEITGPESEIPSKSLIPVTNTYHLRTPLNFVVATQGPERSFLRRLVEPTNAECIDAWIKSSDREFYAIEFPWKDGEHTKRGSFNPDFFLKKANRIYVVEIKEDAEIAEASAENRAKFRAAREHFTRINAAQSDSRYGFHFLTPGDYDSFFQFLREDELDDFRSTIDAELDR
jgi:type III restriction enzyme